MIDKQDATALARNLEAMRHKSYLSMDDQLLIARAAAALRATPSASAGPQAISDEHLAKWVQRLDWDTGLSTADEIKQLRALLTHIGFCAPQTLLREPTEAMLCAARDWSIKKFHRGIGDDAAIGCWQAMYDAQPQQADACPECEANGLCAVHAYAQRHPEQADGRGAVTDAELEKWAREWHWEDCKRESIDHTIYPRDLRMLKACIAKFAAPSSNRPQQRIN